MVHLEVVAGAGYRLAGEQVTVARDALSPKPDYYVDYFYGARFSVFPEKFGFQAGYQRHLFRAASFSAGGGFSVYNDDTFDGGLAYAMPLDSASANKTFLIFGAGLNYSMLSFADEFKSGLQAEANRQGKTLVFSPDQATGVGGYLQAGVMFFLADNIFVSGTAKISYINTRFSGASKALDSWGIEVPLSIGLAF